MVKSQEPDGKKMKKCGRNAGDGASKGLTVKVVVGRTVNIKKRGNSVSPAGQILFLSPVSSCSSI